MSFLPVTNNVDNCILIGRRMWTVSYTGEFCKCSHSIRVQADEIIAKYVLVFGTMVEIMTKCVLVFETMVEIMTKYVLVFGTMVEIMTKCVLVVT